MESVEIYNDESTVSWKPVTCSFKWRIEELTEVLDAANDDRIPPWDSNTGFDGPDFPEDEKSKYNWRLHLDTKKTMNRKDHSLHFRLDQPCSPRIDRTKGDVLIKLCDSSSKVLREVHHPDGTFAYSSNPSIMVIESVTELKKLLPDDILIVEVVLKYRAFTEEFTKKAKEPTKDSDEKADDNAKV